MEHRVQFFELLDVDHDGAADPQEPARRQSALERGHGLTQHVRFLAHVQLHIIVSRFDPIDIRQPQKDNASFRFHRQTLGQIRLNLDILEQRREAPLNLAGLVAMDLIARTMKRGLKTVSRAWFHQVIQRMHVERPQSEIVVGSDKNYHRHPRGVDLGEHAKTVQFRHSHIQENQVGRQRVDRSHGFRSAGRHPHDFDVWFIFDHPAQELARQQLVIDDQCADLGWSRSGSELIAWIILRSARKTGFRRDTHSASGRSARFVPASPGRYKGLPFRSKRQQV